MTTHQIGANIRKRRLEKGHTNYRKFAEANGFNRTQYLNWEHGEDLRVSSLLKVAQALNIEPQELLK